MKYRVKIKNPNKIFIVNNKPVRSPFQCYTNEDGLCLIKSRIKFYGLVERDYEIESIDSENFQKDDYSFIQPKREPIKITPSVKKERTNIFNQESMIKDPNHPLAKSKQKLIEKEEIKVIQKPKNIKTIEMDLSGDSEQELEQILNENDGESAVEVKIEELTIKSSSILEKFLHSEF